MKIRKNNNTDNL